MIVKIGQPNMKEKTCKNCGQKPLAHTAIYMTCPNKLTQYEPDINSEGHTPEYKPTKR